MGRYFDYREWDFEEICQNLRKRIYESKQPIPKKVMKHSVSILYRISKDCCTYPNTGWFSYMPEFKTVEDAEKYLESIPGIDKDGGLWINFQSGKVDTYEDKNGIEVPCHYEIRENDYEVYEDGNYYTEYSDEEKEKLSETLYNIEKMRVYLDVYDHCCDQYSFGNGHFSNELKEELEKFEKNYNEDYIPDEEDNEDE